MHAVKFFILIPLLSISGFHSKNSKMNVHERAHSYVDQFKYLAIDEMHRTGIPASITLAQGLHESQAGQSPLATEANNHFGIKCKSYWSGQTYYHKDDDYDQSGRLLDSCFRAYDEVEESYTDHSDFLRFTKHYQKLFDYTNVEYTKWAKGLQSCGYATDPNYANKLIKTIEKYNLHEYDQYVVQYLD